jgi:hypothetical protein
MISTTPPVAAGPAVKQRPVPWAKLGWVTLRQRRGAMIGAGVLLGAFAVYLAVMAVIQNNAYATVAACHPATASKCQQLLQLFTSAYWGGDNSALQSGGAQTVSSLMFAVPVLVGAFIGAPVLARELETGTFRFAWTQGAGRTRWAISTLVLPAALLTAVMGAFTALFYWYYRPFLEDGQVSSMLPLSFALLGVALAAWTLFSFALAAFLGAVFKRIVPAMAVTLVVYIALALTTATTIRPHYETPVTVTGWNGASGAAWVTGSWIDSPDGQPVSENEQISLLNQLPASALNPPPGNPKKKPPADSRSGNAFTNWLLDHGYKVGQSVQPNARFWRFQLTEGGWLLAASALLIGGTVGLVRRRGA